MDKSTLAASMAASMGLLELFMEEQEASMEVLAVLETCTEGVEQFPGCGASQHGNYINSNRSCGSFRGMDIMPWKYWNFPWKR